MEYFCIPITLIVSRSFENSMAIFTYRVLAADGMNKHFITLIKSPNLVSSRSFFNSALFKEVRLFFQCQTCRH